MSNLVKSMTAQYQCLQCWRRIDVQDTRYECESCESRKREAWMRRSGHTRPKVSELAPSFWDRLLSSDSDARHPICDKPICYKHKVQLKLFCECNAQLSPKARLNGGNGFALGFAGAQSSGKTLLTATMIQQFRQDSKISLTGIEETEERFNVLTERLILNRLRPISTLPESEDQTQVENTEEGQPRNFGWQIHLLGGRKPREAGLLTVYDVGGETWSESFSKSMELFDRYLSHLTALVFLIDGAPLAEDLDLQSADAWDPQPRPGDGGAKERQWLSALTQRLGNQAKQVDLALTVSKADLLWRHSEGAQLEPGEEAGLDIDPEKHELVLNQLLAESGRGDLVDMARSHFRRVSLFAVSSLGFTPEAGDVHDDALTRKLEPVDVVAPLQWLFEKQVPRYKRRGSS